MHVIEIDRVIVASNDVDQTVERLQELLDIEFGAKINTAVEAPSGDEHLNSRISPVGFDVVAPDGDDTELARFLEENGPGLYGVTLRVPDVEAAKAELAEKGIDPVGRLNADGFAEVFYHPRDFEGMFVAIAEFKERHPVEYTMKDRIVEE